MLLALALVLVAAPAVADHGDGSHADGGGERFLLGEEPEADGAGEWQWESQSGLLKGKNVHHHSSARRAVVDHDPSTGRWTVYTTYGTATCRDGEATYRSRVSPSPETIELDGTCRTRLEGDRLDGYARFRVGPEVRPPFDASIGDQSQYLVGCGSFRIGEDGDANHIWFDTDPYTKPDFRFEDWQIKEFPYEGIRRTREEVDSQVNLWPETCGEDDPFHGAD